MDRPGKLLSTEQAAELWARVCDSDMKRLCQPVSGQQMRKLCRTGVLQGMGIEVRHTGERYWGVNGRDLLTVMRAGLAAALERAEKELGDG